MWVGGYDDWTPAEQREWDRDLAELEREEERKEKECETQTKEKEKKECETQTKEKKESKTWMNLALEDPLYKAIYLRLGNTDDYVVELKEQRPVQRGARNLMFEVVHPL